MSATVTIYSRFPAATELRLYRMELWPESTTEKRAIQDGRAVTVAGVSTPGAEMRGDFAVTRGIDKAFFAAWLKQNPATSPARLHGVDE